MVLDGALVFVVYSMAKYFFCNAVNNVVDAIAK
jgi:hypothetical protein